MLLYVLYVKTFGFGGKPLDLAENVELFDNTDISLSRWIASALAREETALVFLYL